MYNITPRVISSAHYSPTPISWQVETFTNLRPRMCAHLVPQNIPECNYDGGDCCSCTCEDTSNQECGRSGGFACIDPEAACVDDDDITVDVVDKCGDVSEIGEAM